MKKVFLILTVLLAGCATNINNEKPTPQQLADQLCPVVMAINSQILSLPDLDPKVSDKINSVKPLVSKVCAAGEIIDNIDLKNISSKGIPLLIDAVIEAKISAGPSIVLGLNIANITISQILAAKQ